MHTYVNEEEFENCTSETPKVSKYIANLVELNIFKNYGTNFNNNRDQ